MSRMSVAALARCRRLVITPNEQGWLLTVIDPKVGEKVVAKYVARTQNDLQRTKISYMTNYRIPEENVTIEDANASNSNRKSSPIHESGVKVSKLDEEDSDD